MSHLIQARRVALLHPALLTAVWVAVGVLPIGALLPSSIPTLILISMICGWAWGVYTVSMAKAPQDNVPQWTSWVFLAPPALILIGEIAKFPTSNSPIAFLMFGTLFFGLWHAAQALEYADRRDKPITTVKIIGTMFLMFFAIIGVWWLRQRIVRVASSPSD